MYRPDASNSLLAPLSASDTLGTYQSGISASVLGRRWPQLVVRVMSARDHDFGNAMANSFYRPEVLALSMGLEIHFLMVCCFDANV